MAPRRSACKNGQSTARNSADMPSTRRSTKAVWKCFPLLFAGSISGAPLRLELPPVKTLHCRCRHKDASSSIAQAHTEDEGNRSRPSGLSTEGGLVLAFHVSQCP